jgi:hypothetical protein
MLRSEASLADSQLYYVDNHEMGATCISLYCGLIGVRAQQREMYIYTNYL